MKIIDFMNPLKEKGHGVPQESVGYTLGNTVLENWKLR